MLWGKEERSRHDLGKREHANGQLLTWQYCNVTQDQALSNTQALCIYEKWYFIHFCEYEIKKQFQLWCDFFFQQKEWETVVPIFKASPFLLHKWCEHIRGDGRMCYFPSSKRIKFLKDPDKAQSLVHPWHWTYQMVSNTRDNCEAEADIKTLFLKHLICSLKRTSKEASRKENQHL